MLAPGAVYVEICRTDKKQAGCDRLAQAQMDLTNTERPGARRKAFCDDALPPDGFLARLWVMHYALFQLELNIAPHNRGADSPR